MTKTPFVAISIILAFGACSDPNVPYSDLTKDVCNSLVGHTSSIAVVERRYSEGACIIYFPNAMDFSEALVERVSKEYGVAEIKALDQDTLPLVSEVWEEYIWPANSTCSISLFNYVQKIGSDNTPDSIKVTC